MKAFKEKRQVLQLFEVKAGLSDSSLVIIHEVKVSFFKQSQHKAQKHAGTKKSFYSSKKK